MSISDLLSAHNVILDAEPANKETLLQLLAVEAAGDDDVDLGVHHLAAPQRAEALLAATDEAVRNSLAHAAGRPPRFGVTRLVEVSADDRGVQVAVRDDGVGFDPARVDPRRLGLRQSILERVHALPGGHARVDSSPGAGTTVTVGWRAT